MVTRLAPHMALLSTRGWQGRAKVHTHVAGGGVARGLRGTFVYLSAVSEKESSSASKERARNFLLCAHTSWGQNDT
jgi:hypothetical protein